MITFLVCTVSIVGFFVTIFGEVVARVALLDLVDIEAKAYMD